MGNPDADGGYGGTGELGQQARRTGEENELWDAPSSSWPTPNATVANDGEGPDTWRKRQALLKEKKINGNGAGVPLSIVAQETTASWPTPQEADGERGSEWISRWEGNNPTLLGAARLWPTSRAEDAESAGNHPGAEDSLTGASQAWQTPKSGGRNAYRGGERADEPLLAGQAQEVVQAWATPRQSDHRSGEVSDEVYTSNSRPLTEQVNRWTPAVPSGHPDPMIGTAGPPFSLGGRILRPQLSALFVEWLMGVPAGWTCVCAVAQTVSAASGTPLSPLKRPVRFVSSGTAPLAPGSAEPWFKQARSVFGKAP